MYKGLQIMKNASYGADGYPVGTAFFKLWADGITNTKMTCTIKTEKGEEFKADDSSEYGNEIITGIEGAFSALGISGANMAVLLGLPIDNNGVMIGKQVNADDDRFTLFWQGKDKKGLSYQMWIYKAHISKSTNLNAAQKGSEEDLTMNYTGEFLTNASKESVFFSRIYEGQTGWLTVDPTPGTILKEVPKTV